MGEVDTKPIESVQVALSLFGEKWDQSKCRSTGCDEFDKEKEFEGYLKDLANYKVQLDAKDSAYLQAILKLEHYQKTADELSKKLKNSERERDKYAEEYKKAKTRIDDLESKMNEIADQVSENVNTRVQLSHVISELKVTQGELLSMEIELASASDLRLEALTQAELMETAANMEKEKIDELLKHVSELNEAILMLKLTATEEEKKKLSILSEKKAEIEIAKAETLEAQQQLVQAQEQLEDVRKQVETMQQLEIQLLTKSVFIDTLQLELAQAIEQISSSEKAASEAIDELNQVKTDLENKDKENREQAVYIGALEMELNQLKLDLENVNEEVDHLNCNVEVLKDELQNAKDETDEIRRRETEAQIEIALLKSELHKGGSKIAALEAGEERAKSVKSGLYLAVLQLAVESKEAKKETQRLKQGTDPADKETESPILVSPHSMNSSEDMEFYETENLEEKDEEKTIEKDFNITISLKEYESLIRKAEKADQRPVSLPEDSNLIIVSENKNELEIMRKELEAAMTKIGHFRTRAEQAVSRAELAEKAKTALEAQLRKWREQMKKKKAALAALREESVPREYIPPTYKMVSTPSQPLGKILNMKF